MSPWTGKKGLVLHFQFLTTHDENSTQRLQLPLSTPRACHEESLLSHFPPLGMELSYCTCCTPGTILSDSQTVGSAVAARSGSDVYVMIEGRQSCAKGRTFHNFHGAFNFVPRCRHHLSVDYSGTASKPTVADGGVTQLIGDSFWGMVFVPNLHVNVHEGHGLPRLFFFC